MVQAPTAVELVLYVGPADFLPVLHIAISNVGQDVQNQLLHLGVSGSNILLAHPSFSFGNARHPSSQMVPVL